MRDDKKPGRLPGDADGMAAPAPAAAHEPIEDGALRALGMRTRRAVLGHRYVDAVARTEFSAPFQTLITEAAWGRVWSRPDWTKRERSIVTIALLAALGHHDELAMHVEATVNTGASADDVREALLHVAIYAGVPAANAGMKIAERSLRKMAGEERDGL